MFEIVEKIKSIPVHMDYKGQQFAEKVFNVILILFGACGFVVGYYKQQFHVSVLFLLSGFLLSCLIVLPPWPCYRRHPLQWQKPRENAEKSEAKKDARKKTKAN
ncbi:signal peptidase complex subunit 1-like [Dendronephthya gigantea]|uniref:signal peptidase complex subunit 1-like n=1 Tax=Dendronephthya gigantea TaxID=151771 RepID=UPI001069CA53|nr:signal peptidase complex subunit 1-like [Dendronephthya gigantea]XP_028418929.1 signal peptidase complex subunit 1-like [Dendronephthya gigantea]